LGVGLGVRAEWQERLKMPTRMHRTTATALGNRWQIGRAVPVHGSPAGAAEELAQLTLVRYPREHLRPTRLAP